MLCQLEAQVLDAILLEFLGNLCPAGFCLSMIPFINAINVICTENGQKMLRWY